MKILIEVSRSSNCVRVEIVGNGNTVVSRRKERAKWFYKVGCSKVKIEQEGEVSCGKVYEECAKKVAEGSDASRKYVARVRLNWSTNT